ncbi:MAG: hypothetical protein EXS64_00375 [Candidatus Latescibacteria bacterium]|nr:hypothetical protein [Candidatus Latescibacterota bacterium]
MVLNLHLPDRFVRSGSSFAFEVSLRELTHLWPATKRALLEKATVLFPGFRLEEKTIYANGEFMGLCGSVAGPGFHPIEVRISVQDQICVARDYVTVLPEEGADRTSTTFPHYGYYVFLTRRGFTDEAPKLAFWGLEKWRRLIDWMAAHGMGQVWFTMNCFYLAYPSRKYPELVDTTCANVREPFLNAVIAHAHRKGVQVHLAFTSDDDRLRDLTMAQYPTLSLAPGAKGMIDDIHRDYFGTRARMDAQ